jgi:predicted RNA-binding Zn-ribbon protein involved in translation (DUF1610 family)
MNTIKHRYSLESGSKKHLCPNCGKKRFNRYIDHTTSDYIAPNVGLCDRLESCGYHLPPKEHFRLTGEPPQDWRNPYVNPKPVPTPKPGRISLSIAQATFKRYDKNDLVCWLATLPGWDADLARHVARLYHIGTGGEGTAVDGWPIFWQIDNRGEVRSGKLIRYNPSTGKRIKGEGFNYTWIHKMMMKAGLLPDDESEWSLQQCLFGLHLITPGEKRPVAIVEGEKTALIASQYLPGFVWLACGSLGEFKAEKLRPLKGRTLVLYPDKGKAFERWKQVASDLQGFSKIQLTDILERFAPDEHQGYDIADYLLQFDIRTFKGSTRYTDTHPYGFNPYTGEVFDQRGYPADWDDVLPPDEGTPGTDEVTRIGLADTQPGNDDAGLIRLLADTFYAVIDTTVSPDVINAFWKAQEPTEPSKAWRSMPDDI